MLVPLFSRLPAVLLALALAGPPALATAQPVLSGTDTPVNAGAGDQVDPHLDCDLVAYTDDQAGFLQVRHHDLVTGSDAAVTTEPGAGHLPDVHGSRVVWTHVSAAFGSRIGILDTADASVSFLAGPRRVSPALGDGLVAFEDRTFRPNSNESEIVAVDLATGAETRVTDDALLDRNPAVTPGGDAVVFEKCETTGHGCQIHVATQTGPGVFVTSALTSAPEDAIQPATNGAVVVYAAVGPDGADIAYVPIEGGAPTRLSLPGDQWSPSVSGNLVAFVSRGTEADANADVFVLDLATSSLFRLPPTPGDDWLPDISVCGSEARVAYMTPGAAGDYDVRVFRFVPPAGDVPLAALEAKVEAEPEAGALELKALLTLGAASDGIDPLGEEVSVRVGPFALALPAGSFAPDPHGRIVFEGLSDGVTLEVRIAWREDGRVELDLEAEGADLAGIANPVAVSVGIGDDAGTTTVEAEIE